MQMPKLTVSNYPEMLRKLSTIYFLVAVGTIILLRRNIPEVDWLFAAADFDVPVKIFSFSIPIAAGTLLISFIAAAFSESIKLHDKISDLLKIRLNFDIQYILIPMALIAGSTISSNQFDRITSDRDRLMGRVFYDYASSTTGKAVIDSHAITQALTAWSWYWACIEAQTIILLGAFIAAMAGHWALTAVLLFGSTVLMWVSHIFRADIRKCGQPSAANLKRRHSASRRRCSFQCTIRFQKTFS